MLFQVPALDDDDRRVVVEVDDYRRRLGLLVGEPRRWNRSLRRDLVARAIVSSNTIEGYVVNLNEATSIVTGTDVHVESPEAAIAAVSGYHDAMTYVQQSADFEEFVYEQMLLSALHFMMLRHELGKWPGRYRTSGVMVTGGRGRPPAYVGPDAEQVPGLMAELVEWLNDGDLDAPVFVRAAMAHLNLVSIHPWRDGNGRMSRCLHTLVLARDRVLAPEFSSIEEWLGMSTMNTADYYQALRTTRDTYLPEGDAHEWVRFCLRTHHLQAQMVDRRVRHAGELWELASHLAGQRGLDERMAMALHTAASGQLRRVTYAQDEGLSRDQSLRDLNLLVRLQLIEPVGGGNRRHYIAAGEWRTAAHELQLTLDTEHLHEPYR